MDRTRVQCGQVVICVGRSASRRVRLFQHLTVDLIRAGLRQRLQIHNLARILVWQKFRFNETLQLLCNISVSVDPVNKRNPSFDGKPPVRKLDRLNATLLDLWVVR